MSKLKTGHSICSYMELQKDWGTLSRAAGRVGLWRSNLKVWKWKGYRCVFCSQECLLVFFWYHSGHFMACGPHPALWQSPICPMALAVGLWWSSIGGRVEVVSAGSGALAEGAGQWSSIGVRGRAMVVWCHPSTTGPISHVDLWEN